MCKEGVVCRTTSMDEIENFPYEFESLSRSVSSSSSIAGEGGSGETSFQQQEGGNPSNFISKTPPLLFNEMFGVFNSSSNFSFDGNRNFSFSPVATMPVRSDSKQSMQDIENLCRSLSACKSTGSFNLMTSISISPTLSATVNVNNSDSKVEHIDVEMDSRPPGFTRMPSFGTEFKPAYLYTQKEESQVESLIGLTFDEQGSYDIGLSIDNGISPKVTGADKAMTMPLIAEKKTSIKNDSFSSSYSSIVAESKAPYIHKQQNSRYEQNTSLSQQSQHQKIINGGTLTKVWHPDTDDVELFACVLNTLKSYTLGVKEIIGLRQILRNKFGDQYVNRFNKKLSSKSLLWRYNENELRLIELVKARSRKFTLVVKNETSMFYLCTTDNIPEGFSRWIPRSDPTWATDVATPTMDNNKKGIKKQLPTKTTKGPHYLDEQSDVTLLAQPPWKDAN